MIFVLTLENAFLRGFIEKPKNGRDFQKCPPFERSAYFYLTINGNFERFQYFNFETDFLENKNIFQKAGVQFLVENTKIKNASFLYKTAMSKVSVKTNRMGSVKWTMKKNGVLSVTTFFFRKICFSLKTSYKELV